MKTVRSVKKIICLIMVICLCMIPVYAEDAVPEDVIEFIPYDETSSFAVFDLYADVKCSAAQAQEILGFVNQIRKEACDSGMYFTWTSKYLSPSDYVPLSWNGAMERYALTRAVDILFIFAHGVYSIEGMVAGASAGWTSENICWMGYDVSPMVLLKIYYDERNVYLDAYNRAIAEGVPADQLTAYINANAAGAIGHYMSLINPAYRSIGSATVGRGVTKNVTLLSYSEGDGNYFNTSGYHHLRIPVSAARLGSVFFYNYPKTIKVGESSKGYFYLAGASANDSFVRTNNMQIEADNPEIVSVGDDMATYTANRKGVAGFRIMGNGQLVGNPFSITVSVPVISVEPGTQPNSLSYTQTEGYSLDGAQLKVNYQDGTSEYIPVSPQMVVREGRNGSRYDVVLAYQGLEAAYSFNDETPDYTVALSVVPPSKLSYIVGESLDLTGGQAILDSYHGVRSSVELSDPEVSVSGFDSSYEGMKQVSVSVDGFTGSFTVNIERPVVLTGIDVEPPEKNYYQEGEDLDLTKGKLRLIYSNGSVSVLALDETMISGYNKNVAGTQAVHVGYGGFETYFYVNVYGKVQNTEIIQEIEQSEKDAEEPDTVQNEDHLEKPDALQNEDSMEESGAVQVPMNASDPWLVAQAVKLYGLRPDLSAYSVNSGGLTWKGWPISCINMLMYPESFCSITLQAE